MRYSKRTLFIYIFCSLKIYVILCKYLVYLFAKEFVCIADPFAIALPPDLSMTHHCLIVGSNCHLLQEVFSDAQSTVAILYHSTLLAFSVQPHELKKICNTVIPHTKIFIKSQIQSII